MPDEQPHKCRECGFITLRNQFTGELDEVDSEYRKTANSPKRSKQSVQGVVAGSRDGLDVFPYPVEPICFVRRHNLWAEIETRGFGPSWKDASPGHLVEVVLEI